MDALAPITRILVVDDDAASRFALKDLLEAPGREVVVAGSGSDALRNVLRNDFAAIVLDARMPDIDGFETARMIRARERSRHTPIIFLTAAYEDLDSVFRGYEAGAVDYISKPPVPEVLRSKIAIFVQLHEKNEVLVREIAERRLAEEQLKATVESLARLTARLQSVREDEWTRISREIHDELGQTLTGLKLDLVWLGRNLQAGREELDAKVASMTSVVEATMQSVRRIASWLRPEVLDRLGLAAAIEWQVREFRKRTGIRCRSSLPAEMPLVDHNLSVTVYRILQELLTNVARHAKATRLEVDLQLVDGRMELRVEDNGAGIGVEAASSPTSLGLVGMRERARLHGGSVELAPARPHGTRAQVSIPLPAA